MKRTTFTAECSEAQARLLQRVLVLSEELEQLALTAPDGTVFDACETAVLQQGRQVQTQMLADAVARRLEAAEKKGRRCASVSAAAAKRTAGPRPGRW